MTGVPSGLFVAPPTEGTYWVKYVREDNMKLIEVDAIKIQIARLDIEEHACQNCADGLSPLALLSKPRQRSVDSDYSDSYASSVDASPNGASARSPETPGKWKFL